MVVNQLAKELKWIGQGVDSVRKGMKVFQQKSKSIWNKPLQAVILEATNEVVIWGISTTATNFVVANRLQLLIRPKNKLISPSYPTLSSCTFNIAQRQLNSIW